MQCKKARIVHTNVPNIAKAFIYSLTCSPPHNFRAQRAPTTVPTLIVALDLGQTRGPAQSSSYYLRNDAQVKTMHLQVPNSSSGSDWSPGQPHLLLPHLTMQAVMRLSMSLCCRFRSTLASAPRCNACFCASVALVYMQPFRRYTQRLQYHSTRTVVLCRTRASQVCFILWRTRYRMSF